MKSSKGGAYVASGSYACTFSPPMSCGPSTRSKMLKSRNQQKIGKVFEDTDDALREAEIQRIIHAVDPQNTFTVKYVGRCKVASISPQDEIDACDKDIQKDRNMQLIYGYGGKDLWNVIGTTKGARVNDTFVRLFLKFEPLFRGVSRLNSMGYLHLDIKLENIVYDGHKLSLVDFGLMNTKSQMLNKAQKALLSYDYPYYPPEFKFLSVIRTINPQTDFLKFKTFFMRNFGVIAVKEESLIHRELERFFASYIFQTDRSLDGERLLDKADIYSVGVSLMILYSYIVQRDDYRTYIIHDLIKDMVNCNPYERPSWEEIMRRILEIKQLITSVPGSSKPNLIQRQMRSKKTPHADILSIKTRSKSAR
jgi:hypothetical protein